MIKILIHRTVSLLKRPVIKLSYAPFSVLNFSANFLHPDNTSRIAIEDRAAAVTWTYGHLSENIDKLTKHIGNHHAQVKCIGCFNSSGPSFALAMFAAWKLGVRFVPLCSTHTESELRHVCHDSKVELICGHDVTAGPASFLKVCGIPFLGVGATIEIEKVSNPGFFVPPRIVTGEHDALVVYTSGTTGKPKGVLHTHSSLFHMVSALTESWEYSCNDKILHFLPLYHIHGLINKLLCTLSAGGTVEFLPSAAPQILWERLAIEDKEFNEGKENYKPLSLLMAVPTVYARMLETQASAPVNDEKITAALRALRRMRLMVCGSAALPDNVLTKWKALTGVHLLERYGMTEIGMALSNPYKGERKQGYVGKPLPFVNCRLVDEDENTITEANIPGELRIKGPNVFREYLNRKDATRETFDSEGWFRTGDIAEMSPDGAYKILGRNSTDIIKSSGYKLSALEIERELLSHPQVLEAAVLGVKDDIVGEKVVALISLREGSASPAQWRLENDMDGSALRDSLKNYLQDKLAVYKQPRVVIIVQAIPRNHLGKVNKKSLLKDLDIVL